MTIFHQQAYPLRARLERWSASNPAHLRENSVWDGPTKSQTPMIGVTRTKPEYGHDSGTRMAY